MKKIVALTPIILSVISVSKHANNTSIFSTAFILVAMTFVSMLLYGLLSSSQKVNKPKD